MLADRTGRVLPDDVERAEGDLDDLASLEQAACGASAGVHLAALFRTRDEDAIWQFNHQGTKNLIAAVQKAAPAARFVMTSTKVAAEAVLRTSGLAWVSGDPAGVQRGQAGASTGRPSACAESRSRLS